MSPPELHALYAFAAALVATALLTPLTMRLARSIGAVDRPSARGLSDRPTPLLGGLAIFAGVLLAGLLWLPGTTVSFHPGVASVHWHGVLLAAAVIVVVGAVDDRFDLHPAIKLAGQIAAAVVAEQYGIVVEHLTVPLLGVLSFPNAGPTLTVIGLVGMMNVVNFSDGVDGLAAGVCAIIAATFALIAFNLGTVDAGVLAALTAGAALGFLVHNFPPASSFMGDCGANLLGLLMGCIAVAGDLKTTSAIAFALPLILLAVPFLDTTFVVLKRLKYGRPVYVADAEHFHHRLARIGFSVRHTVVVLYGWTLMLAGLALALRFIPYSAPGGHLRLGWSLVLAGLGLIVAAASVYLVYLLEILKFRGHGAPPVVGVQATAEPPADGSAKHEPPAARSDALPRRHPSSAGAPRPL
ncbi:MAG: MraY family glycosyltransferase [Solirubrobacteraceae bacterium]|jgi:UDP-GlcNAc:undecaprenyl-phosphate GlcNAc-1-phosphate transferase